MGKEPILYPATALPTRRRRIAMFQLKITNIIQIVPTTLHIIFAGIIFILSFTVYESPRYLAKVSKQEEALKTMSTLRNLRPEHPYVQTEMMDIQDQLEREREATLGSHFFGPLKELFLLPSNRYRIMIGLISQLLSQWSGATSITIYAPKFFAMLGTTGQSEKLFATAIFGVVKLISSLVCALFLVDLLGRKRALAYGITLQFLSMLYVAIYFAIVPSIKDGFKPEGHTKRAGTAAIISIYVSGVGWALGWNSVQVRHHDKHRTRFQFVMSNHTIHSTSSMQKFSHFESGRWVHRW